MERTLTSRILLCLALAVLAAPVLAQSPPDAEARFSTGVMHLREGRPDLALEEFKKAVKEDPKNPYFQKGLGLAYAAKQQWKDAIEAFHKALELNPYYVDVRNDLGTALIGSGEREEGKKEFLTALNDPTNPTPEISARNLGQACLDEKSYDEAINWFKTSLARNKAYPDPYLGLAEALFLTGRTKEAVAELEIAAQEAPDDPNVLLALGQAYYKVGRFTESREKLNEVVQKDPASPLGRAAAEQLKTLPH
jgi:Tfp pilus assembly protein PilF